MRVNSRNIKSIDYNRTEHTLFVVFNNRPRLTYIYHNFLPRMWVKFVRAYSKGEFFASYIRDEYSYTIKRQ